MIVRDLQKYKDDYIIPDQVLQWMKGYQEQGIK